MNEANETVCLLFGPPRDKAQDKAVLSRFFAEAGKHVVCGGTTASLAAAYLGTKVMTKLDFPPDGLPPVGAIEGVDLVTEGILTMNRVLSLFSSCAPPDPESDSGADRLYVLLRSAKKVRFWVGTAENSSHLDETLPIPCRNKAQIAGIIARYLSDLGIETETAVF